jgi:hypothetical protein
MAGQSLGAPAPVLSPSSPSAPQRPLHLVATTNTRTRRNHGAFTLGGQLACVYSARGAGKCYGVSFELGAGTLSLAARMTAGQARNMARALLAAADAVDGAQAGAAGGAA